MATTDSSLRRLTMSGSVSLGIDISKTSFHAAPLQDEQRAIVQKFANTEAGFEGLRE